MTTLKKFAVPAVIVALVVAVAITMFTGSESKRLVAHFPRTISVYEGSEVRVLGVPIGHVETVEPSGTDVVVTMAYDSDVDLPDRHAEHPDVAALVDRDGAREVRGQRPAVVGAEQGDRHRDDESHDDRGDGELLQRRHQPTCGTGGRFWM